MAFDGVLKFGTAIDQTGFKSGIGKLGDMATSAASGIASGVGKAVSTGLKLMTGAVVTGTAAVTALGKQALDAYADFEQLSGGVETLFGDAAQTVMDNAAKAFETAGMSANDYMETATSSAAAMVNSLAGDTKKAAELTDMAITDMADNINKMGSAAESVQNAYAGFAKGNFTMLDNLKLGYGGTKEEMERLLADAQALTGIQYDISSYSDIVQAIHAIQVEMGITGTTAKEASDTISGSTAAMKAAWENLLVGVADDTQDFDKLADDFVGSVETAASNILPRVETIGDGVVKLIGALGDDAVELLVQALSSAPDLVGTGVQLVSTLVDGVVTGLPRLLPAGKELLLTLANGVINGTPDLLEAANGITDGIASMVGDPQIRTRLQRAGRVLLNALGEGLTRNLPILTEAGLTVAQGLIELLMQPDLFSELLQLGVEILGMLGEGLIENLPVLLDAALQIILMLVQMLTDNVDPLVEAAITLITVLSTFLIEHAPELLTAAIELILAILNGLLDNADMMVDAAIQIITVLADTLTDPEKMGELLEAAFELLSVIFDAMTDPDRLSENTIRFKTKLFDTIKDKLENTDWASLGKSIVDGIMSGLLGVDFDMYDYLDEFGDNWVTGIKGMFEIHSPSRLMAREIGKPLAQGIEVGFTDEMPDVGEDVRRTFSQQLQVSVDEGAVSPLQIGVDEGALAALREAQTALVPSSFVPEGAGQSIINNYQNSYVTTNNNNAPGGGDGVTVRDIIVPVSIGGEELDTVVVHAAQSANAASGGVTL